MNKNIPRLFVLHGFLLMVLVYGTSAQEISKDADPQMIGSVTYTMPQSAIDAEIDGKVVMAIHVDRFGKPTKAAVAGGLVWPCSTMPSRELDDLYSDLSKKMLELQFSPAVKNGQNVEKDFGLAFTLKNPKLSPKPEDMDTLTGKPKILTINGGIVNGKAAYLAKPSYPVESRASREGGAIAVQILVDEQGRVMRAGAINGPPRLQFARREAACKAFFNKTLLEGNPVKVVGVLNYNFVAP